MVTPPLGGVRSAGDQTCGRLTGMSAAGELHCGQPAIEHIAWTAGMDNGLVCAEHYREAQRRWAYHDHHPVGGICTNDGARWVFSWDDPPGYCGEPVADGWLYHESYDKVRDPVRDPEPVEASP